MSDIYYSEYLKLKQLLSAQAPESEKQGRPAHDETLFIVVHQVYELWFKQILHELDSIRQIFSEETLDDRDVSKVASRLYRITEIQRLTVDQIKILETMTPMDFLEFRDFIVPASGFQSVQFRLIENKLGLRLRNEYAASPYFDRLKPEDKAIVQTSEKEPSLVDGVDKWLSRTPFLNFGDFSFWEVYRGAVEKMLVDEEKKIRKQPKDLQPAHMKRLESNRKHFESLFDQQAHEKLVAEGKRRLSLEAMKAALLILLYRDRPVFHLPFEILNRLGEMDESFTTWRYRHAQMVFRMIGDKMGTGGSSGYEYLKATAERHRVFFDIGNLSTFLIPTSELPSLPIEVEQQMGFSYQGK